MLVAATCSACGARASVLRIELPDTLAAYLSRTCNHGERNPLVPRRANLLARDSLRRLRGTRRRTTTSNGRRFMDAAALRKRIVQHLLDDIEEVRFPSPDMMDRVEAALASQDDLTDYAEILVKKVKAT